MMRTSILACRYLLLALSVLIVEGAVLHGVANDRNSDNNVVHEGQKGTHPSSSSEVYASTGTEVSCLVYFNMQMNKW